jgi:hypothetical protein
LWATLVRITLGRNAAQPMMSITLYLIRQSATGWLIYRQFGVTRHNDSGGGYSAGQCVPGSVFRARGTETRLFKVEHCLCLGEDPRRVGTAATCIQQAFALGLHDGEAQLAVHPVRGLSE